MIKRDTSIDILKFFAVFLIINSHMDSLYVKYDILATGGAIGDVLFLFASGYTLLMSKRQLSFDNWYKRRINRIYPSVFVCAVVGTLISGLGSVGLMSLWGGQFVVAIMFYYILIYFIKHYAIRHVGLFIAIVAAISLAIYCLWFPYKYETSSKGIYGVSTLYRWIPYTAFMLMGAWVGLMKDKIKMHKWDVAWMIICLGLFYGIQFISKKVPSIAPIQIVTLLPLFGFVFFFYKWCNFEFWDRLISKKVVCKMIMIVSGLCLESYLIQGALFTTKMNGIFPFNLPIMVAIVLLVSYFCKCLSKLFTQTFSEGEYKWKEIIKPY